jgi:hypothetical protein
MKQAKKAGRVINYHGKWQAKTAELEQSKAIRPQCKIEANKFRKSFELRFLFFFSINQ